MFNIIGRHEGKLIGARAVMRLKFTVDMFEQLKAGKTHGKY